MEAAIPLRKASVRCNGNYVLVDGLVIDDETVVGLVVEQEKRNEDPSKLIKDAVEIGARVLDREQTGANVEFVRNEFEKVSREVETAFTDKARNVAEYFGGKVDEVFSPDSGHLTKALGRHFSDESSVAVQNRVRALVEEVMAKSREDLLRQFSAADGRNPLADFKQASITVMKDASDRQDRHLRALHEKLAALEKELQGLRDERSKKLELSDERDRGTAKGRTFEESVFELLDQIAAAQGDICEAVGDSKGATGKSGDVLISIEGASGPARGRIVVEAKNSKLSRPEALRELDRGLAQRDADFAILVVCTEDKLPAKMNQLREYNGDKLIVAFDPEDNSSQLPLEVAYSLARARVLMKRNDSHQLDPAALGDTVERTLAAMDDVRRIKSQLTGATTSIDQARSILDDMAARVREHLQQINGLISATVNQAD